MLDAVVLCKVLTYCCSWFHPVKDFHPRYREFQTFQLSKPIECAEKGLSAQKPELGVLVVTTG